MGVASIKIMKEKKDRRVLVIGCPGAGSLGVAHLEELKAHRLIHTPPKTNTIAPTHAMLNKSKTVNKSSKRILSIINEHRPTKGNDRMVCLRGMYDDILRVPRWRAKIIMEHNPIYTFTSKKVYKRVQRKKR